ncbi:MAG: O-antigen ligase family protein [Vicinamibacterales bacterium]
MTGALALHRARDAAAVAALGIVLAVVTGVAVGRGSAFAAIALAVLAAAALVPVLAWLGLRAEGLLLFALAATLSLSLKVHPLFRADHIGGAVGVRISVSDLLVAGIAVLVLLRAHGSIRLAAPRLLVWPIVAWTAFALLSTVLGPDPELGFFQILAMLQSALLFLFLSNYVNSRRRLEILFAGLLCGLVMQSAAAVAQWRFPGQFELTALGSQAQGEVVVTSGGEIDLPSVDLGQTVVAGQVLVRPMGMLIHANLLAVFLVTQLLLAVCLAQSGRTALVRWAATASAAIGALALYATLSRSGWGVAVIGFGVWLLLSWRWRALRLRPAHRVAATLAGIGLAAAVWRAAPLIWLRLTETASEAVSFRSNLSIAALRLWADHPIAGAGLNTFVQHVAEYDPSGMSRIRAFPVHNIFLLELSEAGIGAGLAIVAFAFLTIRETWKRAHRCRGEAARLRGIALFAGVLCFWIADMFAFSFRIPVMAGVLWSLVAIAIANQRVDAAEGGR